MGPQSITYPWAALVVVCVLAAAGRPSSGSGPKCGESRESLRSQRQSKAAAPNGAAEPFLGLCVRFIEISTWGESVNSIPNHRSTRAHVPAGEPKGLQAHASLIDSPAAAATKAEEARAVVRSYRRPHPKDASGASTQGARMQQQIDPWAACVGWGAVPSLRLGWKGRATGAYVSQSNHPDAARTRSSSPSLGHAHTPQGEERAAAHTHPRALPRTQRSPAFRTERPGAWGD